MGAFPGANGAGLSIRLVGEKCARFGLIATKCLGVVVRLLAAFWALPTLANKLIASL